MGCPILSVCSVFKSRDINSCDLILPLKHNPGLHEDIFQGLLDKHEEARHLLSSGFFDVIGLGYNSFPSRLTSNSWWVSSR